MYARCTMRYTNRIQMALLGIAVVAANGAAYAQSKAAPAKKIAIAVYKTPTCGCCAKWVEHMQANGFTATVTNMPDLTAVKTDKGIPSHLNSCHTAVVGRYVVEGHVPAAD